MSDTEDNEISSRLDDMKKHSRDNETEVESNLRAEIEKEDLEIEALRAKAEERRKRQEEEARREAEEKARLEAEKRQREVIILYINKVEFREKK